jgi:acylphosphatase
VPLRPPRRRRGVRKLIARAHVVVKGRVQAVFFRAEIRDRAQSLGLAGWVRNNPDGSVEAVFEGDRERIESIVAWCRKGPALAEVADVAVDWVEPQNESGFTLSGGWA